MNTLMKSRVGMLICNILFLCLLLTLVVVGTENVGKSIVVEPHIYEMNSSGNYEFSNISECVSMSYGKTQLGTFSIAGNITDVSTYRGVTAYGTGDDLVVSFSYSYDGALQNKDKKQWNLLKDKGSAVNGVKLSGSVGKGALIIQVSNDGESWANATNPIVNFYSDNPSGKENFYTTSGVDVAQGRFYRVIFAYQTGRKTGSSGALWWKEDVYEKREHVEVYEFYLVANSGTISVHNLSLDNTDIPEVEGFEPKIVEKGETLVDGSVTSKGFSIDKLNTSYVVQVSKNGKMISNNVADGFEFTDNGKYTVTTITKLGKTSTQTFYVFNGGDDMGYSTYFGSSLISGNRIYDAEYDYPTYAKNASIVINPVPDYIPPLMGVIKNDDTKEILYLTGSGERQEFILTPGEYTVNLYNSTSKAGSIYQYTFKFRVVDEGSGPRVNYNNLMTTERLSDYNTKHYEVAFKTTAGGYIFVCFSLDSYDEAFDYAYEIEKRKVEKVDDGWYYDSEYNTNNKVKYLDATELTRVLNDSALRNVEYNYFNAIDPFTYRTYDNNLLEELETISIRESIRVFPSQEEKEKLFNRQPFLNDFTFIKSADYDVVSVSAYCYKNAKTYDIEFGKDISRQLTVSSKYEITETNIYGDSVSYDAYYMNDNLTESTWNVVCDEESVLLDVSSDNTINNVMTVDADVVTLKNINNAFDPMAIVTLKAPSVYSFEIKCLVSELKSISLYKKGTYQFTFVDRVGNSYQLIFNISGKARYDDAITGSSVSYTELHNTVYRNSRDVIEEIIYDSLSLKLALDRDVDENRYTKASFTNYERYYNEAKSVYENEDSSQEEINMAVKNLEEAFNALEHSADKTELVAELDRFETADKELYTVVSYGLWEEAYVGGNIVYNSAAATDDEISSAVHNLKKTYNALVRRGNKTNLYTALVDVESVDCSLYTPGTVEKLNEAYTSAVSVYNDVNASQNQIDSAIEELKTKKSALRFVADFSSLYSTIEEVKGVDQTQYTTHSVDALKVAFDEAVGVYKDRNNSQEAVNKADSTLKKHFEELVLCGDDSDLRETVNDIAKLVYMIYTKDSIEPLFAEYNSALALLEGRYSQNAIDETVNSLKDLKSCLIVREDKAELYTLLTEMAEKDFSTFSNEKYNKFKLAYDKADEVLHNLEATEQEVLQASENLKKAYENLSDLDLWQYAILICGIVCGALIVLGCLVFCFIKKTFSRKRVLICLGFGGVLLIGATVLIVVL